LAQRFRVKRFHPPCDDILSRRVLMVAKLQFRQRIIEALTGRTAHQD
jgi:hypothetical protein